MNGYDIYIDVYAYVYVYVYVYVHVYTVYIIVYLFIHHTIALFTVCTRLLDTYNMLLYAYQFLFGCVFICPILELLVARMPGSGVLWSPTGAHHGSSSGWSSVPYRLCLT